MLVGFYQQRLIPALVNVAASHRPRFRVITLRVRQGEALHKLRQMAVRARNEVESNWDMAVITRRLVDRYRQIIQQKREKTTAP